MGQSQTKVLQRWFCPGSFIPPSACLIPSALSARQQLAWLEGNSKVTGVGEVLVPKCVPNTGLEARLTVEMAADH